MNFDNFYKRFINKLNSIIAFFIDRLKKSKKKVSSKILNLRQRRKKRLTV